MPTLFYVSLAFFAVYFAILLRPGMIEGPLQTATGILYYTFCILLLISVYQKWHSIWIILGLAIVLFIAMYALQIIAGMISDLIFGKKA